MRKNVGRDLICSIRNLFDCEKWELDHSSKNSKYFWKKSPNTPILPKAVFIWSQIQYNLKEQLPILIYFKILYSCDGKSEFLASTTPIFSVTWFFWNHAGFGFHKIIKQWKLVFSCFTFQHVYWAPNQHIRILSEGSGALLNGNNNNNSQF